MAAIATFENMKRTAWVWGGFGAVLAVGILSGYVPDLMLANELRGARTEGLLSLPPAAQVRKADDAAPLYAAAYEKSGQASMKLANDLVAQMRSPSPDVVKYLAAMERASEKPAFVAKDNGSNFGGSPYQLALMVVAAKAFAFRAKDEASLLPAARIARHLGSQTDPLALGLWAALVPRVLDRAAKLGLAPEARSRLAQAMGPAMAPREALRRHIAEGVEEFEKATRNEGPSVGRTRQENGYLRYWRGFFRAAPPGGTAFVEAVRKANDRIQAVELGAGHFIDLESAVGKTKTPWAVWSEAVEKAGSRLAAP